MAWALDHHPKARNLGIYNCRNVRGGSSMSCHAEGRALDVGFPMVGGRGSAAGRELVKQLLPRAAALGIQTVIYDRVIYSAKSPKGRRYTGSNPHYDHVHIELTRMAAEKLTKATIKAALVGKVKAPTKVRKLGSRTLRRGSAGADVTRLQKFLGVNADSTFGDGTHDALRVWQRKHDLAADGIAGPKTLAAILKKLEAK